MLLAELHMAANLFCNQPNGPKNWPYL